VERRRNVVGTVARAILEATEAYEREHPEAVDREGFLSVGITATEYASVLARLDSTVTGEEQEDAILELERRGCFRARNPSFGHNYGLWRIEKGRLASFAK
jgi:hypothetical protein